MRICTTRPEEKSRGKRLSGVRISTLGVGTGGQDFVLAAKRILRSIASWLEQDTYSTPDATKESYLNRICVDHVFQRFIPGGKL